MNLFTRWRDVTIDFEGVEAQLRLRAPLAGEGREIQRKVRAWRRDAIALIDQQRDYVTGTSAAEPEGPCDLFERIFGEAWAREVFQRDVKLKAAIEDDDGKPIAGGAALFDLMGTGERVAVLYKLDDLAFLRGVEGKASPSPSTSSVETIPATPDGTSAATSTDGGGGQQP